MRKDYETDVSYPPVGAAMVLSHDTWAYRPEVCRACKQDVKSRTLCCKDPKCPRFKAKEKREERS